MTDEELLIWLRVEDTNLTDFAADRIEDLTKEREQWRRAAETRAEGWKISDDARIETEIKLAKAVEALEDISGNGNAAGRNPQLMSAKARATLAEIKGESHDPL